MFRLFIFLIFTGSFLDLQSQKLEIISPYERGTIENGKPVGKWEFCDSIGTVTFSLDYSNGKLTFDKIDTSSFLIKQNNFWLRGKLDSPARFYGSYSTLLRYYIEKLPSLFSLDKILWLVFDVNETGQAVSPSIIGSVTNSDKKKIMEVFENAPNYWIPGVYQGKNISTRFCIPIFSCTDECIQIKNILKERWDELGKSLFPIGYHKYKKLEPNYKVKRYAGLYFSKNQLLWSKDDSKIVIKMTSPNGIFTHIINSSTGVTEKTLFANDPYLIKCTSDDCNTLLINYSPLLEWDFIAQYCLADSKYQIISDQHDILPTPNSNGSKIGLSRRENGSQKLVVIDKEKGTIDYSTYFSETEVRPLAWIDESRLICSVGNSMEGYNQLEIFDITDKSRIKLSIKNAEFVSLSPNGEKILIKEKDPTLQINSRLVVIDLKSNNTTNLFKSFKTISSAYWFHGSDFIFYSIGNKSRAIEIKTLNDIVLNKISSAYISHSGKKIVHLEKNGKFYIRELDGSNPLEITGLLN